MTEITLGFGQQLVLDGYGADQGKLQDMELIYRFLDEYPAQMGMTKIMPPYVFKYKGLKPEDWGISGIVLIAESHISIHTFPDKQYLSCDFFSCKHFNTQEAADYIIQLFGVQKFENQVLDRGREFPKNIELAGGIIGNDRQKLYTPVLNGGCKMSEIVTQID